MYICYAYILQWDIWYLTPSPAKRRTHLPLLVVGGWTNILVHHLQCPHCWGVGASYRFCWLIEDYGIVYLFGLHFCIGQSIEQGVLLQCPTRWHGVWFHHFGWMWRRLHVLPFSYMLCSLIPHCAYCGIFCSPFGEWFNNPWDTLRGEASMFAEPLEDFCILICVVIKQIWPTFLINT